MAEPAAFVHESMPLTRTLGITTEKLDASEVVLRLEWAPELCTAGGILHGGALMALADSAGAVCAFLNLPEGATATSTIESKTNFLGAVREGSVTARATVLHAGRTTIVVETTITGQDERLVAKTIQTQAVLGGS
ncbi:MAG TPA: PaaI family thioesterase [Acidimicrobiia bacterium]